LNPKRLLAGPVAVMLLASGASAIELNSSEALKYYGQGTQDFRVSPTGNALIDDGTLNITNNGEAVANFSGTGINLYKPLSVRSSGPLSVANGIELTGTSSNTIESLSTFYLSTSSGSASDIVLDPTGQVGVDSNLETTGNISVGGNQLDLEEGYIENAGDIQTGSVSDSDGDNEIDFNSNRLTGLKDPNNEQDAATKSYVDSSDDTIQDNQGLEEVLSLDNRVGGENINFNETSNIQASGTNAITLDNQQNVGIPNGNLDVNGPTVAINGNDNDVQYQAFTGGSNTGYRAQYGAFEGDSEAYGAYFGYNDNGNNIFIDTYDNGRGNVRQTALRIDRGSNTVKIPNGNLNLGNNNIDDIASLDGGGDAIQVNDQIQLNNNRLKTDTNGNYIEGNTASFSRLESGSGGEIDVRSAINFNDVNMKNIQFEDAGDLNSDGDISDGSVQDAELDLANGLTVAGGAAGDGTQDGLEVDGQGNLYFSGSLNFPGDVNTVNAQELDGSFLPSQDAQFNIGSTSAQWKNGYFSGTVTAANFEDSGGTNLDDKYVNEAGDTMTDNLNLGGNDLTNIGDRGNGIRIGDPTGVNGIADSDFYGIDIQRDTDNAFFGLRNYGDDADDVVINNEQNDDDIRVQSDGQDRLIVRGSGGVDIPTGNLDVSGGNINDANIVNTDFVQKAGGNADIEFAGSGRIDIRNSNNNDIIRARNSGEIDIPRGNIDVSGGTVDARGGGDLLNDGFRLEENGVLKSRRSDGNLYLDIESSGGTTRLRDSGNNDIVRANDNGNVEVPNGGVDIGSPSSTGGQLDVGGGANFNGDVDLNNGGGLDNVNDIEMDGTIFGAGVDFSLEEVGDIKGPNNGDTDLNIQTQGGGGHVVSIEDGSSSNADIARFKEGSQNVEIPNGNLNIQGKITEIGGKGTNEIRDDGDLVVDSDDKIEFADNGNTYMEVGASASEGDTQIDTDGDVTTNGRLDANSEGGEISDDSGSSMDVQTDGDVVVTLG
jgi:hypothetical protein